MSSLTSAPQNPAEASPRILNLDSTHLGKEIDLEACARVFVDRLIQATKSELVLRLGEGQVHLFPFGAVVFLGIEPAQAEVLLAELTPYVEMPASEKVVDDYLIEIRTGARDQVCFEQVILGEEDSLKIQMVASVLAQSTTLEHFEKMAERMLQKASSVTDGMASGGRIPLTLKQMIRFIGAALSARREIVSRLSIMDAPEMAWEDRDVDKLFHDLKSNFEFSARFRSLEYKLRLIHESVEVIVNLTNTRRSEFLELTIIALIALEIILALLGA